MLRDIQVIIKSDDVVLKTANLSSSNTATIVKAQKGLAYEFLDMESGNAPEVIYVKRDGNDLHVSFANKEDEDYKNIDAEEVELIIRDYYIEGNSGELIGLNNGSYQDYGALDLDNTPYSDLENQEFAYQDLDNEIVIGWLPIGLGLFGLGALAGAAGGGGSEAANTLPATPLEETPAEETPVEITPPPTLALVEDTGRSATDNNTYNQTVKVSGLLSGVAWEYSVDGGQNWVSGSGTTFDIDEGEHLAGTIQVKQIDSAGHVNCASNNADFIIDITPPAGQTDVRGDLSITTEPYAETMIYDVDGSEVENYGYADVNGEIIIDFRSFAADYIVDGFSGYVAYEDIAGNTSVYNEEDIIIGGAGDDTIIGGKGSDLLWGGANDSSNTSDDDADTFLWNIDDVGTVEAPAIDRIMDFNDGNTGTQTDISACLDTLDIKELLVGLGDPGTNYILDEIRGDDTYFYINSAGALDVTSVTTASETADQIIILDNYIGRVNFIIPDGTEACIDFSGGTSMY